MEAETRNSITISDELQSPELTPKLIFAALAGLFVLNLLLRIFYLRYDFVNGDEAIRALTATGWLDGARLYIDIVTDKPPATTFFYAAVFRLFGRSMTAIHLAAAVWNFCTALVLYQLAASSYRKRTGLWAALVYVYFSTNYLTQDMMAANTELLMALPYTASFYCYVKAWQSKRVHLALLAAGVFTGVAILFKQLGVFNLAFFGLCELLQVYRDRNQRPLFSLLAQLTGRLATVGAGVAVVLLALISWLYTTGALADFWRHVYVMNTFYISSIPPGLWLRFFVGRTFGYLLLNLALWSLAIWAGWRAITTRDRQADSKTESASLSLGRVEVDRLVTLWAIVSLAAVFAGGRFFGHYFIQALAALALLAARGAESLQDALQNPASQRKARFGLAVLLVAFLIGVVRFHGRTAILAYETLTGAKTAASESWGMSKREAEAAVIAQNLQGKIGAGEPLYIWDYALDVYWRTGTRPAARYLTPNHVTGVFTDAETRQATAEESLFWAESRRRLIEDLKRTRPHLILDVTGGLLNLPYEDLTGFVQSNYTYDGELGIDPARPFVVYRLNE